MKIIPIILACAIALASCGSGMYSEKAQPCSTSATGDTVALAYKQPVEIFQKCADNMRATLDDIKDSRCPKGVQCVWAGTVNIVLSLDERFMIRLEAGKQVDTTYNQKKYSFTLIDVTPYPVANTNYPPEQGRALVRITKS